MPVVDASVVAEYLTGGDLADEAREHMYSSRGTLWAPHLIDAEVGHVLRRVVSAGELGPPAAEEALDDLAALPLRRTGHVGLLERAWELRENFSFHDALYVALAERLELPLITFDIRLAAAPEIRATIEVIS